MKKLFNYLLILYSTITIFNLIFYYTNSKYYSENLLLTIVPIYCFGIFYFIYRIINFLFSFTESSDILDDHLIKHNGKKSSK